MPDHGVTVLASEGFSRISPSWKSIKIADCADNELLSKQLRRGDAGTDRVLGPTQSG